MKGGITEMNNKRGLSAIVSTLIIILLAIVAIGAIAIVINNFTGGAREKIELSSKCLDVDVQATKVSCAATDCSVTLKRADSSDVVVSGVQLIFLDANKENSDIVTTTNAIEALATRTESASLGFSDPSEVSVAPVLSDADGEPYTCEQPVYTFQIA